MSRLRNRHGATRKATEKGRGVVAPLAGLILLCLAHGAAAQAAVGTVVHLSGVLSAKRADGTTRLLAARSEVREGDTLVTEADSSVEMRFVDDSLLVLSPATQMRVTRYAYDPAQPAHDEVALDLLAGGFRSITGQLGHRNHDAIRINAGDAVIKVRGTTFVAQFCSTGCGGVPSPGTAPPAAGGAPPAAPSRPPGLYLQVLDGAIVVSNAGAAQSFAAGQFGFVGSVHQPPVMVPVNPGIMFAPPPAFTPTTGPSNSGAPGKAGTVDCEVR